MIRSIFWFVFLLSLGNVSAGHLPDWSKIVPDNNFTGTYEMTFPVGEHQIRGSMELFKSLQGHVGRMVLQLSVSLNISLNEVDQDRGRIVFSTSAPAIRLLLNTSSTDSISGSLRLTHDRVYNFFGVKIQDHISDAITAVYSNLQPEIGSDSAGYAFPTLSPDETLMIYSAYKGDFGYQELFSRKFENGSWKQPQRLPFSGRYSDRGPVITPGGKFIYFGSKRPDDSTGMEKEDYDIWYVRRKKNGKWKNLRKIEMINSSFDDYQPCVTNRGIYFISNREGGQGGQDVYFAPGRNGKFGVPVLLPETVNSPQSEMHVYVTPNEDIMILTTSNSSLQSYGNDDLYLFKKVDENWTLIRNLGQSVNTFANEYGAYLTDDRQWLYYTSDVLPQGKIFKIKWSN